jgi:putative hemolysin
VLIVLLALHAYFAAARESIAFIRKSRRLQLIEEGKAPAQIVDDLAEDVTHLLTTEQLALKFLGFFIIALAVFVYAARLAQAVYTSSLVAALIITVISAVITLLVGELIPKEIARNHAETITLWSIYPFGWLSRLARPLAQIVTKVGRILTGHWDEIEDYKPGALTEEDLRSYVDVGQEEGVLKEAEKEMIHSIFELDDTMAREVMVPRIDIMAVEADASIEKVIDVIIQAGHSRLPVYDDTIDNIVGILYVKDLLVYWLEEAQPGSIRGLERKVYYVPETKPVSDLLRELQTKKVHIAIVVDEFGGTAGLVTIEDIIEEIVGEIQDEHDADEFYMQYISDDEYIFSAGMDLDDINNVMSLGLPTDKSDTLGGLIYNVLGRIPKTGDVLNGESFDASNLHFIVLGVDGRRIKKVKIIRLKGNDDTEDFQVVADESPSTLMGNMHNTVSESS